MPQESFRFTYICAVKRSANIKNLYSWAVLLLSWTINYLQTFNFTFADVALIIVMINIMLGRRCWCVWLYIVAAALENIIRCPLETYFILSHIYPSRWNSSNRIPWADHKLCRCFRSQINAIFYHRSEFPSKTFRQRPNRFTSSPNLWTICNTIVQILSRQNFGKNLFPLYIFPDFYSMTKHNRTWFLFSGVCGIKTAFDACIS